MIDGRERYKVTGVRENQSYVGAMCVPIWSQTIPTIRIEAAGCSDFNGECLHTQKGKYVDQGQCGIMMVN